MPYEYAVLLGPDGAHDSYRFTVLDACVVAELGRLFRDGLPGINDAHQKRRLRSWIWSHSRFGELWSGTAAAELAWRQETGSFDPAAAQDYVSIVAYLAGLTTPEWQAVLSGRPPRQLPSARERQRPDGWTNVGLHAGFPQLLASYAILREAWRLAAEGAAWEEGLEELTSFIDTHLGFMSALPAYAGLALIAGNTTDAAQFRRLVGYGHNVPPDKAAQRVRSASWDLAILTDITLIPTIQWRATGEHLRPACALTADKTLAKVSRLIRHRQPTGDDGQPTGLLAQLRMQALFSEDRVPSVEAALHQLEDGVQRRDATSEPAQSLQLSLMRRADEYLARIGDTTWTRAVQDLEDQWDDLWSPA